MRLEPVAARTCWVGSLVDATEVTERMDEEE
jgi:hypothetical protein